MSCFLYYVYTNKKSRISTASKDTIFLGYMQAFGLNIMIF